MKSSHTWITKGLSLLIILSMILSLASVGAFTADAATVQPTALVLQKATKWKSVYYGGGNLYDTGCGMFAIVNAVGYLTGNTMSVTEVASWGHSIGGYNPGNSHDGTYRMTIYPRLQAKYGTRYGFTVNCGSTNEGFWAGSSSSTLKNHLAGGGVAIGHVPGHFIAIVGWNGSKYHVYDSYPTTARGTGSGDCWVTPSQLATGKLKLDWFCLLTRTGTVINNQAAAKTYTVTFDSRGGSAVTTQSIEEGKYATKPATPTRSGYEFLGWYDENGYEFLFPTTGIWANRYLHAEWRAITWPAETNYMPTQSNTVAEEYPHDDTSYVWQYFHPYNGSFTMYKGGEGFSYPSSLATYRTSVDLSKYAYLNVSVAATARFNAYIIFRDINAQSHAVSLSQMINGTDNDFAPGNYVLLANVGSYLYSGKYELPATGIVNIEAIRYYVVGETDQFVTLNAVCFSGVKDPRNLMKPDTISQEAVAGATGQYTYQNGELTMEGTSGYTVTFEPNYTFSPADVPYWLISVGSTTNFDMSLVVTTKNGDRTVSLSSDYYNLLGFSEWPEFGIKSGSYAKAFDLHSMYTWNNILPDDGRSTVKKAIIELRGQGRLVLRANQLGTVPIETLLTDDVTKSGSWSGSVDITNDTYVLDKTTDVLLGANANLTAAQVKSGVNNGSYVRLFDGDTEITDTTKAKTGLTVKVMNGDTLLSEYVLAIRGDVDCNGILSTSDVRRMMLDILQKNTMAVAVEAAADMNADSAVSTADAQQLLRIMMTK